MTGQQPRSDVSTKGDLPKLQTAQAAFLQPSSIPGHPPTRVLLCGVNLSGTAKFPTFAPSANGADSAPTTRESRDKRREAALGVRSDLTDEECGLYKEEEEGRREGWFVGRPLLEEEADVHFKRLRSWGFNVVRWIVPWEALEHAGPGKYDEAYIDYTIRLLRKAKEYDLRVFISPHQDVFSRYMSGSGAPYWSIEAMGINPRRVHQTGAAVVHAEWKKQGWGGEEGRETAERGEVGDWPDMIWNTNLHRLASRHCHTMFFASETFAPKCRIDGVPVGTYLRDHWNKAYHHLAERIRDAGGLLDSCVIGWDTMNEPHEGFIGIPDLNKCPPSQDFRKGPSPTPLQGFQLASGRAVQGIALNDFTSFGLKDKGTVDITPTDGLGLWLTPKEAESASKRWGWSWDESWEWGVSGECCPWASASVWEPSTGRIVQEEYFEKKPNGEKYNFMEEFWKPHYNSYMGGIRKIHPGAISFINPPVFDSPPDLSEHELQGSVALSSHFYDGLTMLGKRRHRFNADAVGIQRGIKNMFQAIKFGDKSIRSGLRDQLKELKGDAHRGEMLAEKQKGGREYPTLIGELGVPFDMKETRLFGLLQGKEDREDYTQPGVAMDQILNACDGKNALSYALWCYEPLNTHEHGDGWQGEDLSIFSYADTAGDDDLDAENPPDLKSLIRLGARAVESWCRPFPVEMCGIPKFFEFNMETGYFQLEIHLPPIAELYTDGTSDEKELETVLKTGGTTKLFLPYVHYLDPTYGTEEQIDINAMEQVALGETPEGEEEWEKGKGPGRVAVRVNEISTGRLAVEGQYGVWHYPLSKDGGDIKLVLTPCRL